MFILKTVLSKEAKDLTADEKSFVGDNWDLLNDDLRAKFADAKPADEADADTDAAELDEKALKNLISTATKKTLEEKAEAIALTFAKAFGDKIDAARAKFAVDGTASETKNKANDEITRRFVKALISKDYATLKELSPSNAKALNVADQDDGGYLVPEPLANEIIRIAQTGYGLARQEFAYNLLTQGNSKRITALGSALSVYWVDEGEKKPASQPTFSLVTLALKKLVVIVPMTEEVVEDAGVDLTALVAQLIREAVDKEVDLQFFNGDGTVFTGLLNDTTIPSDVLAATKFASTVRPEDVIGLADNTPLSVNGKYYMHRTMLTKLRTLRQNADGTGDYLYNPLGAGAEGNGTLNGHAVVLSEAFPTLTEANAADKPIMLYGDLKRGVAYGEKSDVKLKLLDQATITDVDGTTVINLAEQDMLALRAVQRVGMKVTLASAMNRLISGSA